MTRSTWLSTICVDICHVYRVSWQHVPFLSCRQEIRTSTSSMTSVPKPLKFLRPHYGTLKAFYDTMGDSELKVLFVCLDFLHYCIIVAYLINFLVNAEVPCWYTVRSRSHHVCRGRKGMNTYFRVKCSLFNFSIRLVDSLHISVNCKFLFMSFGPPIILFFVF